MSELEIKNIIVDYTTNGLTLTEIMSKYHHKYDTIVKILDANNIPHGKSARKNGKPNDKNKKSLPENVVNGIIKTYVEEKKGQMYCAKKYNTTVYMVKKVLRENNIKIRNFSEATAASNKKRRKYTINENYFSIESAEMAYIMGFIAADGSISKRDNTLKIGLSAIDYDFLCDIAKRMGSNKAVKLFTNNKGFDCCEWHCASEKIKKDLSKYNIVPNKTFSFIFPRNLNEKYWIDFIRGYFDGDGTICSCGNNAIRWSLCSANDDILKIIVDFFEREYNIPRVKIQKRPPNNNSHELYYIQYSTKATKQIYKILYLKDSFFLPRKKQKFDSLILE